MNYKTHLLFVLLVFIYSCTVNEGDKETVHGNGTVENEEIVLMDYSQVVTNGAYELYFIQDSIWKIQLEAESNLLPLIDVYVKDTRLIIENKEHYSFEANHPIRVTIHHKGITNVQLNGSGAVYLDSMVTTYFFGGISGSGQIQGTLVADEVDYYITGSGSVTTEVDCHKLEASISGSGIFSLSGKAEIGVFTISGEGIIEAKPLALAECTTFVAGIATEYFSVSNELHVTISGSGTIYYWGNPEVFSVISGFWSNH